MRAMRMAWWAFGLAVVGALVAAFAPLGTSVSVSSGGAVTRTERHSLFEIDGSWVLVVVSVPVLIAFAPPLVRRRGLSVAAAIALWACCVVGVFSVGLFFVPSAVAMTVAAAMRSDPTPALEPR